MRTITNKLSCVQTTDLREYSSYQHAVRFLDFGIGSSEQFKTTQLYLISLLGVSIVCVLPHYRSVVFSVNEESGSWRSSSRDLCVREGNLRVDS